MAFLGSDYSCLLLFRCFIVFDLLGGWANPDVPLALLGVYRPLLTGWRLISPHQIHGIDGLHVQVDLPNFVIDSS